MWQVNGAPKWQGIRRAFDPAQCSSASRRLLRAPTASAQAKLFHSGG
jgi:hypothetical protein